MSCVRQNDVVQVANRHRGPLEYLQDIHATIDIVKGAANVLARVLACGCRQDVSHDPIRLVCRAGELARVDEAQQILLIGICHRAGRIRGYVAMSWGAAARDRLTPTADLPPAPWAAVLCAASAKAPCRFAHGCAPLNCNGIANRPANSQQTRTVRVLRYLRLSKDTHQPGTSHGICTPPRYDCAKMGGRSGRHAKEHGVAGSTDHTTMPAPRPRGLALLTLLSLELDI